MCFGEKIMVMPVGAAAEITAEVANWMVKTFVLRRTADDLTAFGQAGDDFAKA